MNITLIGYKGTGKTTISQILSKKLQKKVISTDEEVRKKTKLTVSKYVKKHGWDKFREAEADVLDDICGLDDCIIDAGGGVVLLNENIVNIKKSSLVILLTADPKTLASRMKIAKKGPAKMKDQPVKLHMEKVMEGREDKYRMAADYAIDTSNMSPEEVSDLIAHYIGQEQETG
ncbi:AAA family ATPase [Candidatus Woesearchaeota archaeon]|nr:AAA family ATPase [Candidatus Woesearchaeota archaeon]